MFKVTKSSIAIFMLLILTACVSLQQQVSVTSVRVVEDHQLTFVGESSLPTGTCIQTGLSEDGTPVSWWPVEQCAVVDENGTWQMRVSLATGGAPAQLDPDVTYTLLAWPRGIPLAVSPPFSFDVASPPAAGEPASTEPATTDPNQLAQEYFDLHPIPASCTTTLLSGHEQRRTFPA